ncbi:MAG: VWA domain-containing protein [Acidobacteriia bacterium]|nr:VWA domain-containing protein [Terriglobia bacterium]
MRSLSGLSTTCALMVIFLSVVPVAPQSGANSAVETIVRRSVEEVALSFTVTNSRGVLVDDIEAQDIAVLDQGQPIREFTSFSRDSDLPLRLGLLVDLSDSTATAFSAEQHIAIALLQRLLRPQYDEAFVLGFTQTSNAKVESEQQATRLIDVLSKFHSGGQTALYDAVFQGATQELMRRQEPQPVRRVIVLLSDGEDNDSWRTAGQAIEEAQSDNIAIYAMSVRRTGYRSLGTSAVQRLATETGGRVFLMDQGDGNAQVFAEVEQELRSRYTITYHRAQAPAVGGFHELRILINSEEKLRAHYRAGYYAPSNQLSCDPAPRLQVPRH